MRSQATIGGAQQVGTRHSEYPADAEADQVR
jgi:hypothetical protein